MHGIPSSKLNAFTVLIISGDFKPVGKKWTCLASKIISKFGHG